MGGHALMGISIIVASSGRPSLHATLASIAPQLVPGDQLLVDVNDDAPWGHAARNRTMEHVQPGQGMMFMDDDDVYLPRGIVHAREAFSAAPERVHIFRILGPDAEPFVWRDPVLRVGNVSTQCVVVPQAAVGRASWGDRYAGDFDFIEAAARALGEPVFHEQPIAMLRTGRTCN